MQYIVQYFVIISLFYLVLAINRVTIDYNNTLYKGSVNNTVEFIFSFNKTDELNPSRVIVTSYDATQDFPVLVVARQQRQILSWQLPLLVDTRLGELKFNHTNRTLCPDDMTLPQTVTGNGLKSRQEIPLPVAQLTVSISSSSPVNITFTLLIEPEVEFHVVDDVVIETEISPSAPKIFYYQFSNGVSAGDGSVTDNVLLEIQSNSNVCMFVSIQNSTCPVYDLEHDIRFEGYWQTISRRGGMNVPRTKFPNGFFIVFVSKSEDYDCTEKSNVVPGVLVNRDKRIRFSVKAGTTRREYLTAILVTLGVAVASHVFAWFIVLCNRRGSQLPLTMDALESETIVEDAMTPTSIPDDDDPILTDNSSMDETEYDTITEALSERNIFRNKSVLFVADLARKPPRILQKKSYLYLWHVITVAVFYGLPVVQLVFTYQRVLADTGNQDLCYYNFLCAHPLGVLSDFNHVLSNAGYVVLGILFIALVNRRERWHGADVLFDRQYGIPQHHGLFYAMGAALIMEGVLSASYHVCPNHTNFQFDSSFMYVMAVLIMVKIYQNRHPDINATAYATFGVLAVAISLGMLGILDGTIYFWMGFTVLHICTCLLLTVQIYYMGCWKCDRGVFMRVFRTLANDFRSGPVNVLRPVYKGRMALLVIGNLCNWALAIAGLLHHDRDFATYLLAVFMSNTLLYTCFYIVMKMLHKERIMWHAWTFILLATVTWATAMYFFINKSISWALTPAESRQYNQPCKLFNFYDPHDIWHFLSAAAMFFSFMILLTLDDDLTHTHRSKIHVF